MNSMTGYGFLESIVDGTQISVEIKSVNSRFLDLSVNLPSFLNPVEMEIRRIVGERIFRGKVEICIRVKEKKSQAKVSADVSAAKMYMEAIAEISHEIGTGEVPLSLIISQEGVLNVTYNYDAQKYWQKIRGVFDEVFEKFLSDRNREGENLKKDLQEKFFVLEECAEFFSEWQPKMEQKFREILIAKFRELMGDSVDENRIMSETAAMLVKYTINEEIVRLKSHLCALKKELAENPTPGKRIDFICQEINREINTIGSKNQFTEIGQKVIDAKDALENIREQAKNVE
jgi:uncharacterized protein (TIGR00255 family)